MRDWDYSSRGYYFVTICTYQRTLLFGSINNFVGAIHESPISDHIEMQLNPYGKIINNVWWILPNRFPILLDYYQIMPNHIHGIIIINGDTNRAHRDNIRAHRDAPLHKRSILSQCIGYFKMNSTKQIRQLLNKPNSMVWQRNFYEHIIRNENELAKIREYIQANPIIWKRDRNNPDNFNKKLGVIL